MTHKGLAPYDVVGSFADLHAAQEAMTRIGRSGIEAGRVSLVGEPVREAAADLDTSDRDGNVVDSVGKRMFTGMAAGGVVGGAVGLLAGAALGAPEIGAAAAGIAAGGAVGGMTSGVASIDLGDDWELTHESDVAGRVLVAVRADSQAEADKAADALDDAGADEVRCLDAEGRPT